MEISFAEMNNNMVSYIVNSYFAGSGHVLDYLRSCE